MFPPQTYQSRRQSLLSRVKDGPILLLGNELSSINYPDQHYPFRQDSSFLYYLGIDRPHVAALLDPATGETTLYGDDYSLDHLVWMGPQPRLAELAAHSGLTQVKPYAQLGQALAQSAGGKVHFLPPYRPENEQKLISWLGLRAGQAQAEASLPLIQAIVAQRSYKSDEERAEMILATQLTGRMHQQAMRVAHPGRYEADVMAQVYATALAADSRPSFSIICSVRGEVLHNTTFANPLLDGQLLLVDAGGESPMHYAGDMTRTFPVNGRFSQQQREIYEIVLRANRACGAALRPGLPYREVHLQAAQIIVDGLKDLGLMRGDTAEAVAAGAHAMFFPHGLGHQIGLDVHDMEDLGEDHVGYTDQLTRSDQFGLSNLRLARPLEAGFCLTVEPGLYFIPELIDRWQADGTCADFIHFDKLAPYRTFGGIRLEDDYLITPDGADLLGEPVPITVEAVEAAMQDPA
jgi:Xaa-Pro aminopeptidase